MNVGLPGTGAAGLFYMLAAVLMPVREAYARGGMRSRWKLVVRQLGMAVIIAVTMWATGAVVGAVIALVTWHHDEGTTTAMDVNAALSTENNVIKTPLILWSLAVLVLLRLVMLVALLVTRGSRQLRARGARASPGGTRSAPLDAPFPVRVARFSAWRSRRHRPSAR